MALCEINAQSVKEYQEQSTCCNRSSSTLIIQIEDLKRTVNAYKVQCDFFKDSLQKEKAEWIAKQTDMEVTIAALEKEVQSLRRLNVELQESAILKGKEIQSFNEDNNLNVVTGNNLTVSNKHPAVGYITPDNKSIHLGYGEYLPKTSYVAAACDCRRPAIFVRQIAICLFSLETLLNSTVTGKGSNRNKNSKQPKNALDCNKILAVKAHTCTAEKETDAIDEEVLNSEEPDIEPNIDIEQNIESNIERDTESNIDPLRMEEAAQVPNEETSPLSENNSDPDDPDFGVIFPPESSCSDFD
ncbi:uncharacterized protein [Temnothorax nylanderi]|uniref:uncharacterized protein isoform X4 n=1 Tax=Temnothorax nylanderi TaxID=102681 RepID=UPI003A88733C